VQGKAIDEKSFSLTVQTGVTPLHLAAENGHQETVEFLLRSGIPIDSRNNDGVLCEVILHHFISRLATGSSRS
jgi:ankyrin repeat protein